MIIVTCAIIWESGKVLAAQRSNKMSLPLKWEFPGGKVEFGESPEACVLREVKEELCLEIEVIRKLDSVQHTYENKVLELVPFECKIVGGQLQILEHADVQWVALTDLRNLDWAAADLELVQRLTRRSSG